MESDSSSGDEYIYAKSSDSEGESASNDDSEIQAAWDLDDDIPLANFMPAAKRTPTTS